MEGAMRQPDCIERLRRRGLVEHLHRLGPAPLGHFLREVENGASIPEHLERYAKIDRSSAPSAAIDTRRCCMWFQRERRKS
jgi:hypothetical protein